MNKIFNILLLACVALTLNSCWSEEDYEAGAPRHQVEDLVAVPGDEEVELTWTMPEGWNPTDYKIMYKDADDKNVTLLTGGEKTKLIEGLANGHQYTFQVQAVYGEIISGAVEAVTTPATSRFPVNDLTAEPGSEEMFLTWTKPGTSVTDYTVTYYPEANPADAKTVTVTADQNSLLIKNLTNDINYIFEITANYPKGPSETVSLRAMPSEGTPYFLSSEYACVGQFIEFTFNTEDYPQATDVTWTFPDGSTKTGVKVSQSFAAANDETKVVLSVKNGSRTQSWEIYLHIREFGMYSIDWVQDGSAYNGFKGSTPVFSPDGKTVYNITFNKVTALYAFDLVTGTLRWKYVPAEKSNSYNGLTVNPVNGDIYFGTTTAGQFYCVSATGELRWQFKGAQSMQSAAPAVNRTGDVVYIIDNVGNVFALNAANGSQIWTQKLAAQGSGILVNDSELVVGINNKEAIHFLNASTGEVIKSLTFTKGMTEITGFAVSNDKTKAYVPHKGGLMSLLDLASHEVLVKEFAVGSNDVYEPVVAPNGDVFVGSKDSNCYIVDGGLTTVKKTIRTITAGTNNAYNYSHPVVDADNRYMISSGQVQNVNIIVNAAGDIIQQWSYGSTSAQKQMGGNNFIDGIFFSAFVGANGDNGIMVGQYVGSTRATSWSSHGGDQCGSCCIK